MTRMESEYKAERRASRAALDAIAQGLATYADALDDGTGEPELQWGNIGDLRSINHELRQMAERINRMAASVRTARGL